MSEQPDQRVMMTLVREWWEIHTKDRIDDAFYKVGGDWQSLDTAKHFKLNCLRGKRAKYAHIFHFETRQEVVSSIETP